MPPPVTIGREEELGRRVFSARRARRARRSGVRPDVFMLDAGERRMSVDRLTGTPWCELGAIARSASASRTGALQGWASVVAETARLDGREAVASPVDGNPYHADIVLPEGAEADRDVRLFHAQQLAAASGWREPSGAGLPERWDAAGEVSSGQAR